MPNSKMIAASLPRNWNEYPDRDVAIEGHTDDVGVAELNQTLSWNRAESVKTYLLQQGIRSRRLIASGMGEPQPVANNDSESGRQQNRRVEIIIEPPRLHRPRREGNKKIGDRQQRK